MFWEDGFLSLLKYLGNSNQSKDIIRQKANKNLLKSLKWLVGWVFILLPWKWGEGRALGIRQSRRKFKKLSMTGDW